MIKVLYLMANVIAKGNEEDCLCIKLRQEYFEMQAMYEQIFNKMLCSRIKLYHQLHHKDVLFFT